MKPLKLYELTLSPNNVKVRIALGLKGLEYERVPVPLDDFPGDRSLPVKVSTQPRLPVLTHGETVIFDSGAILRYLDANFPETHQLFSSDHAELGEIEGWEFWAKTELSPPTGMIFQQAFGGSVDESVCAEARRLMHEATGRIEEILATQDYLLGNEPKAPDVVCAPVISLTLMPPEAAALGPIPAAFQKHFQLGEGRDRTRAWVARMMAHDAALAHTS